MALSVNIDLQNILVDLGRAYNSETSGSSIISTLALATGPQFSVSLGRNLVSSYTNGPSPVEGNDFDILSSFGGNLRTLEIEIQNLYASLQSSFLAAEFAKLNTFIANAYGEDIRSYLNNDNYNSSTGPVYDIHGGFAQSYLDYNGASLIFKVAEINHSGPYTTMFHGPINYRGVGGFNRFILTSFTGPIFTITDENINTSTFTGPFNTVFEYGTTGSVNFNYILGSSGSFRTLAYPRMLDGGYAGPTGTTSNIYFNNVAFEIQQQPILRQAQAPNVLLLKAAIVNDDGDRDFVFKMVKNPTNSPTIDDVEQTQIITVSGEGSISVIEGTTGNTSFYRPFSLVSANGVQDGEIFEIWISE
jgi:hypothetical protein